MVTILCQEVHAHTHTNTHPHTPTCSSLSAPIIQHVVFFHNYTDLGRKEKKKITEI